eukprot:CAMPEP_0115057726 /NCGR_PEP_ID=MMETSP0227-20121206/5931_1 /TAXON_ID=89957 /ORGANISM="Polarella glacialis, Strain CCMP 1383" /LENGTH=198 /DNA_ID=CAMNT_0002442587 /DNA_START=42 /DNA_END=638 /DNA_ORIENTATION=-
MSGAAERSRKRARHPTQTADDVLRDVTRLALQLAPQLRLVHAASVRTLLIPMTSPYVTAAKTALSVYGEQVKAKSGGQSLLPPHVLAFKALPATASTDPKLAAPLAKLLELLHFTAQADVDLTPLIKVCRLSKTFEQANMRLQIAASTSGLTLVDLLVNQILLAGGCECPGIGPRSRLERTLAQHVRSEPLKTFRNGS